MTPLLEASLRHVLPALRLAAWLLLAIVLVALVIALRAYRLESAQLHPARRLAVPLPRVAELGALEAVEIPARNGPLRGWYQASRNGAQVLLVHGFGGHRGELLPQARALARHGYGVLLFDLPGHGESPGRPTAAPASLEALRAALELAVVRGPRDRVGVYGFSFGGCVSLELAAREPRLAAVALEGVPSDLREQVAFEYRSWGFPARIGALVALRRGGFDVNAWRPLAAVARLAPRPVLLIAGSNDGTVPAAMAARLYAAAGEPRELWLVEGAGHGDTASKQPAEYERRLVGFFDRQLLRAP